MTEIIEFRPLKSRRPRRSHKHSRTYTTIEVPNGSSENSDSSDDESPVIFNVPSKASKKSRRKKNIRTLPIIINTQPEKHKKRHQRKQIQPIIIDAQQAPQPAKKEIVIQQIIEPARTTGVQYFSARGFTPEYEQIIEQHPHAYRPVLTSTPVAIYDPGLSSIRRYAYREAQDSRTVHLPRHAKKLVNRFLSGLEYAHGRRFPDSSDSDCSIDNCRVCRRVRSVMDESRHRSHTHFHSHPGDRVVLEIQDSNKHKHGHSRDCEVCNLLTKSDVVISNNDHRIIKHTKKDGRHVHIVETSPSNVKSTVETITSTTNPPRPAILPGTGPFVAVQPPYYPMQYPTYADPNNGMGYPYDPNWTYNPYGSTVPYGYSSYPNQLAYNPSYAQYPVYDSNVATVMEPTTVTNHQHPVTQTTTTVVPSNSRLDDERRRRRRRHRKTVVHTTNDRASPISNTIIEETRHSRIPRRDHVTTTVTEKTR